MSLPTSQDGKVVLGIDPGANTGVALFVDGRLTGLATISPVEIDRLIKERQPLRVVFEDSRLQSHAWNARGKTALGPALATARSLGQVDAWCSLIVAICAEHGIPALLLDALIKPAVPMEVGPEAPLSMLGFSAPSFKMPKLGVIRVGPTKSPVKVKSAVLIVPLPLATTLPFTSEILTVNAAMAGALRPSAMTAAASFVFIASLNVLKNSISKLLQIYWVLHVRTSIPVAAISSNRNPARKAVVFPLMSLRGQRRLLGDVSLRLD